jgi:hypothetical protein
VRGFYIREPHQVTVITPFVRAFVDELKDAIPNRSRSFDPEYRTWTVRQPYVDSALEISAMHFDGMRQLYVEQPAPSTETGHPIEECLRRVRLYYREEATLYLIHGAPWPVIQAAYRATAKLAHPDTGGSNEAMTLVNLAYETLCKRHEAGRAG